MNVIIFFQVESPKKETINIIQKVKPGIPVRPAGAGRGVTRQIILGNPKNRPLPGPIASPLRPPVKRVGRPPKNSPIKVSIPCKFSHSWTLDIERDTDTGVHFII